MFRLCQPRLMFAFTLLIYASECILLAHHLSLKEFNADASLACDPLVGPTFIRYLLEPGHRVPAKRIVGQGANLQVRLQLDEEPMIGLVSGRIAVDVQRRDREFVFVWRTARSLKRAKE